MVTINRATYETDYVNNIVIIPIFNVFLLQYRFIDVFEIKYLFLYIARYG